MPAAQINKAISDSQQAMMAQQAAAGSRSASQGRSGSMTDIRPARHSWDDLTAREEISREEQLVDLCFWSVFRTPDGIRALEFMHLLTTFKRNSPNDSDGALRELEAQRRFVAILEARIERAKKQNASVNVGRTETPGRSTPSAAAERLPSRRALSIFPRRFGTARRTPPRSTSPPPWPNATH
jgi:hypothetical protein